MLRDLKEALSEFIPFPDGNLRQIYQIDNLLDSNAYISDHEVEELKQIQTNAYISEVEELKDKLKQIQIGLYALGDWQKDKIIRIQCDILALNCCGQNFIRSPNYCSEVNFRSLRRHMDDCIEHLGTF